MRCMNCGWENTPERRECLKCGLPLRGNENAASGEKVSPKPPLLSIRPEMENGRKTVVYPVAEKTAEEEERIVQPVMVCIQCGYPIAGGFTTCPQCGASVHRTTVCRQIRNVSDTDPQPVPSFSLAIVPEANEEIKPETLVYSGKSVILNRENTEKDNCTITTKEQAEVIFEDGHWYLIDHSELNTTYLQVNRKIELQPDDIIVLGDRRFKFRHE